MEAAAIDLSVLVERLRTAGFRVDTRQYLIAHELLLACAAQGVALEGDAAKLASHLGPIFCTVPEEQQRFALEVAAWRGASRAVVGDVAPPAEPPFAFWRRWRWRLVAFILTAALIAGAGYRLYYQYEDVALEGSVVKEGSDKARTPAPNAKVTFRDERVPLDGQARFRITTQRAKGFGSLQAELPGYVPASASVGASTPAIELVLKLPPPADDPKPQSLTIGAPEAISLGAVVQRVEAGGSPWRTIALGALETALVAFLLLGGASAVRRRFALQRLNAHGDAEEVTLAPPAASAVTLTDHLLRRLASAWRRPRAQSIIDLDPAATVEATLRTGGLFSPVYTARRATPEYLALVRRRSADDHWCAYVTEWLDKLAATGVVVEVFTFHDDPRTCYSNDDKRAGQRLATLLAQHHRATVLLFADSEVCFDPVGEHLDDWIATLPAVPARVLFTPEAPYRWTHRERVLAEEGFIVLPATEEGFRVFADFAVDWRMERLFPAPYARAYPPMLADDALRWLDRNAPAVEDIERLIRALRGYLGPRGFSWLCAIAVYPQISWPLTLYLGTIADAPTFDQRNAPATLDLLPALARLPWLQHGFMPDWLRRTLIARMSREEDTHVRGEVEALLEKLALGTPPADAKTPHAPAPQAGLLSISRWIGPLDILRAAPAGSPLSDRVFLGFLSGTNADPLSVRAKDSLRKLFARDVAAFEPENDVAATPPPQPEGAKSPRVFIIAQRGDSDAQAHRLADSLRSRNPSMQVFLDLADMTPAEGWTKNVERAMLASDVVLVLIGRRWLEPGASGNDPGVLVRTEIEAAFRRGKPVIPILVGSAPFPDPLRFSPEIAPLATRQAIDMPDDRWADGLVVLDRALQSVREKKPGAVETPPTTAHVPAPSLLERINAASLEGRMRWRADMARLRAWMAIHPTAFAATASIAAGVAALAILFAWLPPLIVTVDPVDERSFVAFSPDGRWLVTRNAAGEAVLASALATRLVASNPRTPVSASQRTTRRLSFQTNALRTPAAYATAAVFAPDSASVVVGYSDGSGRSFDVASGSLLKTIQAERPGRVLALAFRADGTLAALTPDSLWILSEPTQRIDLSSRYGVDAATVLAASFDRGATRIAILIDARTKASSIFFEVVIFAADGTSTAEVASIPCAPSAAPVFSADSRSIACALASGGDVLVASVDGKFQQRLTTDRAGSLATGIAFNPDNRVVAGARADGAVTFWSIDNIVLGSLKVSRSARELATAFNPAGDLFVAATATTLEFWPIAAAPIAAQAPSQTSGSVSAPTDDAVPSLQGMTTSAARSALERHQLLLGTVTPRASVATKGSIVAQSPAPGRRAAAQTPVDVSVSDGSLVRVPNLVGLSLDAAEKTAAAAGLGFDRKQLATYNGTVASQTPTARSEVARGSSVTVVLSSAASPAVNSSRSQGWCCVMSADPRAQANQANIGGRVQPASTGECAKMQGRYAPDRAQAESLCGIRPRASAQ